MAIAVVVVGIGTFIVGFAKQGTWPLLLGGVIIGLGVASMHYLGMSAIRVQDTVSYNLGLVAASVVIAVIAGTAALWAALRLDSLWSTIIASMIMGVAVSGMHYTGMAALRITPDPGLSVNTSATASATAFLLPLILSLSTLGFIFSAVIAMSPTAAEIIEEAALMQRISATPQYDRSAQPGGAPQQAAASQPYATGSQPSAEPGSLFRPARRDRNQ
jgi:NO-binding membrane sensor protein with MHYT domain